MQAIFLTKLARRKESCIDSQLLGYTVTAIIEATTKPKVVASLMVLVLILAKEPFLDYFAGSSVSTNDQETKQKVKMHFFRSIFKNQYYFIML